MKPVPRILPLVGVAVGGVLALHALSGASALPALLSATQAMAEDATGKSPVKLARPTPAVQNQTSAPNTAAGPGASSAPHLAPVCAPSPAELAKAAGLSPSELQVLQSLQARRSQIDDRAKDLDTEVQLLAAAETKLDAKLGAMNSLKAEIQSLMGQADQHTQAEVDRLTIVYSKMKPQDAAAVMAQLDDKVRIPIAAAMKPAVLSAILGKMGTQDAKVLTEKLAHRFAPAQQLADAANAPPGASSAAKPAQTPAPPAAAPGDQASATAAPAVKKPAPHKPVRRAQAAPRRAPVTAPVKAKPVEQADTKPALTYPKPPSPAVAKAAPAPTKPALTPVAAAAPAKDKPAAAPAAAKGS